MLASLTAALLPQSPQYWGYRHMPPHPDSRALSFVIAFQTNSVSLLREWQWGNQFFFNFTVPFRHTRKVWLLKYNCLHRSYQYGIQKLGNLRCYQFPKFTSTLLSTNYLPSTFTFTLSIMSTIYKHDIVTNANTTSS